MTTTWANAWAVVRATFGNRAIFLVSLNDVQALGLPAGLYANTDLLKTAYASVFPGRDPTQVLATSAYDIT